MNIFFIVIAFFITNAIYSQNSEKEKNILNSMFFEQVVNDNFIKFERVTKEGKIGSCVLEYQYAYRDFYSQKGSVVIVKGSFSQIYSKGKIISYIFKISPYVVSVINKDSTKKFPPYVGVFIDNNDILKYKAGEFVCEDKGRCIGYKDKDGSLSALILDHNKIEVKFSLSKGGNDNTFDLFSLINEKKSREAKMNYLQCMSEIFEQTLQDLK